MSSQSFSQLITVNLQYNGIKITKQCSDVIIYYVYIYIYIYIYIHIYIYTYIYIYIYIYIYNIFIYMQNKNTIYLNKQSLTETSSWRVDNSYYILLVDFLNLILQNFLCRPTNKLCI